MKTPLEYQDYVVKLTQMITEAILRAEQNKKLEEENYKTIKENNQCLKKP